jgi:hypothetical protein
MVRSERAKDFIYLSGTDEIRHVRDALTEVLRRIGVE